MAWRTDRDGSQVHYRRPSSAMTQDGRDVEYGVETLRGWQDLLVSSPVFITEIEGTGSEIPHLILECIMMAVAVGIE